MPWYVFILISAFFLGIYSIIEKRGLKETDSISYLFFNALIIATLSIPLIFFTDITDIGAKTMVLLSLKSILATIFFILIAKALKRMEISEFAPFLSFSPAIVLVMSYIFLGERIGAINFLGIFLVILGAYILELKDGFMSPFKKIRESKYIHYIFIGLIFAGFCVVLDRTILKENVNFLTFYFYNNILLFFVMSLFALFRKGGAKMIKKSFSPVFLIALAGAVFYMVGDFTYFKTLTIPIALASLVIPLKRTSILVSTILGGEIFHEKQLMKKSIAALIMLGGVFLIVI